MGLISKKKSIGIGIGVAVIALAVFVGVSKLKHTPKTNVIKIGHSAPLTGGSAHIGKDTENGVRLAIEEVNTSGGLTIQGQNYQLELVSEDDAADPKIGTNAAQRLVDEGVVGVIGHVTSGVSIPANTIYAAASVAQISPAATNPKYTSQSKRSPGGLIAAYRVVATDAKQGPALASFAADKLKVKTVALIDDSSEFGKGLVESFEAHATQKGIQVVAREAVQTTDSNFKAILTKIKQTKPDAIMFGGMGDLAAKLARQIKELKLDVKLLGGDGVCNDSFIKIAADAANILTCSEAGLPLEKAPKGKEFSNKFQARFKQPIVMYAHLSYDATYLLINAIKNANSIDRSLILAQLPKTHYQGVAGLFEFDEIGDLKNAAVSIYQVKNNQKELLDIVK